MSDVLSFDESDCLTQSRLTYGSKRLTREQKRLTREPNAWGGSLDGECLRLFLSDRHPTKTAENVASETGVPLKTVRRWMVDPESEPSLVNFLRLYLVYGPPFLVAVLVNCPAWADAQARRAHAEQLSREIERAQYERAALNDHDS